MQEGLKENGIVVVKENIASKGFIFDKVNREDASYASVNSANSPGRYECYTIGNPIQICIREGGLEGQTSLLCTRMYGAFSLTPFM